MNTNPLGEKTKKVRFLRAGKFAVYPASGPIVEHEIGDEAEYPRSFCDDMVDAGAVKIIKAREDKEKVKEEVAKLKDEDAAKKAAEEEFERKKAALMKKVDKALKGCKDTSAKKKKLAEWALDNYEIKLRKDISLTKMKNELIKEVL